MKAFILALAFLTTNMAQANTVQYVCVNKAIAGNYYSTSLTVEDDFGLSTVTAKLNVPSGEYESTEYNGECKVAPNFGTGNSDPQYTCAFLSDTKYYEITFFDTRGAISSASGYSEDSDSKKEGIKMPNCELLKK